ncbi:hypothetical protein QBC46DRAFT_1699 [Diplogelasinospora grovesii]|uniref:Serine-threonine rich protein n=1 Tax=Diplogelasinospora grovesii TaxID=303347 RepID=A0AAN6SAT4_9PEZI|nr:hypothetical protein QBC46DRAFT_1699 [Diplogelasinospora grovesii]
MKFSAALALGIAPLALGKAVHNVYPGRRSEGMSLAARKSESNSKGSAGVSVNGVGANSIMATEAQLAELELLSGLSVGSNTDITVLWINIGGGAVTTVINSPQTVTVTQQVAGGQTAPPAVVATSAAAAAGGGGAAASATVVAGASGTVAATGATHTVTVGGPQGLSYNPSSISAAIGDTVIFTFLSQNHTATQSAFTTPCEALAGGMDSGFQPNPNNSVNPPPQVAMQVMVSTPLWFYCRQQGHCGKGMTFSINPTAAKTQAMFQSMAIAQNGTGTGSAITGNGGAAAGAGAAGSSAGAGAASSSVSAGAEGGAAAATSLTATLGATAPTATAGASGAVGTGVVAGTGSIGTDGACVCAVSCSFGTFPNVAAQGVNNFGGFGGAIPMNMAETA